MPQPATGMPAGRVMVRPVDDPAFIVVFVDPGKPDGIADPQRGNPRCQIDIMGNEKRLTVCHGKDESLVPAAIGVIFEDCRNLPLPLRRDGPESLGKRLFQMFDGRDPLNRRQFDKTPVLALCDEQRQEHREKDDDFLLHRR